MMKMVSAALMAVACVFYIAATAAPQWATESGANEGLWSLTFGGTTITYGNDVYGCGGNLALLGFSTSTCQKIAATQAFMVMACISSGIAAGILIVVALGMMETLMLAGTALGGFAFVTGLIGFAIGVNNFNQTGTTLGASVACAVIGWILSGAGTVASVLLKGGEMPVNQPK